MQSTIGRTMVLAALCLLLQTFSIPYAFEFGGLVASGSLLHAHVGLLLAIAMLERDRRVLAGCLAALLLGWLVRGWMAGYPPYAAIMGVVIALFNYWWTLACARWMGWPRSPGIRPRIERADLPGFAIIGLLLYPLVPVLLGLLLTVPVLGHDVGLGGAIQTLFARHFGTLVIGIPLVAWWTERDSPRYRLVQLTAKDWVWPLLLSVFLLLALAVPVLLSSPSGEVTLIDFRYALAASLGWAILHLRPRTGLVLLTLGLLLNLYLIVDMASLSPTPQGFADMVSQAFGSSVIMLGMLYLFVLNRDGNEAWHRVNHDARFDRGSGLPNLNALRHDLRSTGKLQRQSLDELGYLLLHQSEEWAVGYGIEQQGRLLAKIAERIEPLAHAYLAGTGQFVLLPRDPGAQMPQWQALMQQVQAANIDVAGHPVQLVPYLGVAPLSSGTEALDKALSQASQLAFQARRDKALQPRMANSEEYAQAAPPGPTWIVDEALGQIRARQMLLLFQPILPARPELVRAGIRHYGEVLCRLRRPGGSLLSPARFIAELEAAGRSHELDLAVWQMLIEQLRAHPQAAADCMYSVNIAGASMASADFLEQMETLLQDFPVPMDQLCIEITESALIGSSSRATAFLERQRQRGCSIAIDDFGTGMQSFNRLKELPVNIIKIDGSFIRNLIGNHQDRELVKASINIAQAFDAQTVAEYVENDALAAKLTRLGADWLQGDACGKPVPLAELLAELDAQA